MWLTRLPGVYPPQKDTWLLAGALATAGIPPGGNILDAGCGTGALSIVASCVHPRTITATDISRRAVWAARLNTLTHGIKATIKHGDVYELVAGQTFDLILANPPYVPGKTKKPRGKHRAWDAGADGREQLDRLCTTAPLLLAPGGTLLVVHSGLCDENKTLQQLRGNGLKASVVARAEEPFGPVMQAREQQLRNRGLITPEQQSEELVVIRGDQAATP